MNPSLQKINTQNIAIVPYSNVWPDRFKQEADRIKKITDHAIGAIHHIGSTAIPGVSAKPVIDLLAEYNQIDDIEYISTQLKTLNYEPMRRQIIPHVSFITNRTDDSGIQYHLHLHERGSPQVKRHILFRDYMNEHPDKIQHYTTLKQHLVQTCTDMFSYVQGKDLFIQSIDAKAKIWSHRKHDFLSPGTGPLAKYWTEKKVMQSMVANLDVHMTHFAQYINSARLTRIPGYTIVNSGLPDDTFNYVLDADFSTDEANNKISTITEYFNEQNVPFSWWTSPLDKPENLGSILEKQGFKNTENNTAMYFDLDAWDGHIDLIPELTIVKATNENMLHDFALVLANDTTAFKTWFSRVASVLTDDDPVEYYVGYVNNKPVVRGLSCYFAEVAGLHWLSTAPDERRKGYARTMQQFRLKRAKDLNYHIAVLQASHEGYPLYKKLGYKSCGDFREFKLL